MTFEELFGAYLLIPVARVDCNTTRESLGTIQTY